MQKSRSHQFVYPATDTKQAKESSVIGRLHLSAGISVLLLVTAAMLAFLGLSPVRPLAAWGEQGNDPTKAPQLAGARRAAYRGRIPEDRTTEMDDHQ